MLDAERCRWVFKVATVEQDWDWNDGSFGKGLFSKTVHFLEILKNFELLEILESPRSVETKENQTIF